MPPEIRRLSGRKVALAFLFLILCIAGTAIGIYLYGREPLGTIRSLTPVDDHRVLLVRDGHRQHGFAHLTLRDVRGGQVWAVPFHGVPVGASPVVVHGRVLLWVENASVRDELHAFELETGAFAFRVGETPIVRDAHPTVALVTYQDRAVAAIGGPTPRIDLIDVPTGRVVVTHELPGARDRAPELRVVASGVEVVPADGIVRLLNPLTGTFSPLPPILQRPGSEPLAVTLADDGTARIATATGAWTLRARSDRGRPVRVSLAQPLGNRIWVAAGASVAVIDAATGRVVGSHGKAVFEARRAPATP